MGTYLPLAKASFSTTAFPYNTELLSDGDDVVSRSASVASGGGVLKRGTILKWDPATGLLTVPAAAVDSNCILAEDIDATSAAAGAIIYVGGKFKADAVIWPGALSHALVTDALRSHDMQIESVVYTDGTLVKSAPREVEAAAAQAVVESNRAAEEAAASSSRRGESPLFRRGAKGAKEGPPEEGQELTVDSPWAYLTPEEREKNPQLAAMPTYSEISDAVEGGPGTPGAPTITLSPTADSMGAAAETSNFAVTMSGTGTWMPTKDVSATWLTIVSPTAPQSASGTVTYAVAANTGAMRSANITVNGKAFTVTQSGGL